MKLKTFLILMFFIAGAFGKVYVMEMTVDKEFVGITALDGKAPEEPESGLKASVRSSEGTVLGSKNFQVPSEKFLDDFSRNESIGGVIKLTNTTFGVVIPFFEEGTELVVYDNNGENLFSKDLSRFTEQEEEKKSEEEVEKFQWWWIGFAVIVVVLLFFLIWLSKSREHENL